MCSVADPGPGSGAFFTPGSGIRELRNTFFGVKILKFFDADLGSGVKKILIQDPG
jgi:hypothetical protein